MDLDWTLKNKLWWYVCLVILHTLSQCSPMYPTMAAIGLLSFPMSYFCPLLWLYYDSAMMCVFNMLLFPVTALKWFYLVHSALQCLYYTSDPQQCSCYSSLCFAVIWSVWFCVYPAAMRSTPLLLSLYHRAVNSSWVISCTFSEMHRWRFRLLM